MRRTPFSEQLREVIRSSGVTIYALAASAGVPKSALARFMLGQRGLTIESVDKLADVLGIPN